VSLDNGLRRDHTVTCTLAGTPDGCTCPFSFWKPCCTPRRRVKVVGTVDEALRLRDHMQREASGTIYFSTFTPHGFAAAPASSAGLPAQVSVGLPAIHAPRRTPTFGEWAQQVMETVWIRHSPRTRQTRTSVYRLYVEPDLALVDLADVNAPFVSAWIAELVRREVSPHMQRHAYDLVRTITGVWYEQAGLPNPVAAVKRPKTIPAQERRAKDCALSAEQYQRLIAACVDTREELLIRVITEASLRTDEACGLQRRDIDLTNRRIRVRRQGQRDTTKNDRDRTVKIVTDDLADALERHLNEMTEAGFTMPDAYLWQGGLPGKTRVPANNRPYTSKAIYKVIRRILKRVKLDTVTRPHGLRATGAILLVEAGASLELVSQQLGHATTRTTEEYYVGNVKTDGLASYRDAFG